MDELYLHARSVLVDALSALAEHRDAVIVVGAHAVYLRVGEADLAVAPFTGDADLAIDPDALGERPPIEDMLTAAGFRRKGGDSVGVWTARRALAGGRDVEIPVDLLVPDVVAPGTGRRAARLRGHDPQAARKVAGLEGALVDNDVFEITRAGGSSGVRARVAGPAALLVAKLHKIHDRRETTRASDKDALDVFRLLRGTRTEDVAERWRRLQQDARSNAAAARALNLLEQSFVSPRGPGLTLLRRSVGELADPAELTTACTILAQDLCQAVASGS